MNRVATIRRSDPDVSADDFRGAMRLLPGGVSVITVGRADEISGMTVTSLSALSADPPTVIVCINRQTSSWPLLQRTKSFGVNFLSDRQRAVAERFTGKNGEKGAARFTGSPWTTLATGAPILTDSVAALDCAVEEIIERHSHAIVIGRVEAVHRSLAERSLAYWQGRYVQVSEMPAEATADTFEPR